MYISTVPCIALMYISTAPCKCPDCYLHNVAMIVLMGKCGNNNKVWHSSNVCCALCAVQVAINRRRQAEVVQKILDDFPRQQALLEQRQAWEAEMREFTRVR
jgi:hypothetical protein